MHRDMRLLISTIGIGCLCLLANTCFAHNLDEPDARFLSRLVALSLPYIARASCEGAPSELSAKLEDSLRRTGLNQLDASYLCRDDLCMNVTGAPQRRPDAETLKNMLADSIRQDLVSLKQHSLEERHRSCKEIVTRLERVKSTDPEQIVLELSGTNFSSPIASTAPKPAPVPARTICDDLAAAVKSALEESDVNRIPITDTSRYKNFSLHSEFQAEMRAAGEDHARGVDIATVTEKFAGECTRKYFQNK